MEKSLLSTLTELPCFHRVCVDDRHPNIHISRCPGRLSFSKHCDYVNNDLLYLAADYETYVAVQILLKPSYKFQDLEQAASLEIYNLNPNFKNSISSLASLKETLSSSISEWTFYILKTLDLLFDEDYLIFNNISSLKIAINSDLPPAAGMSSSHALILASLTSLLKAFSAAGLLKPTANTLFQWILNKEPKNKHELLRLLEFCQRVEIAKGFNSGLGDQAAQILSRKDHFCFIKLFPEISFTYRRITENISFMILPSFIKAEKCSEEYKRQEKYFERYRELNKLISFFLPQITDSSNIKYLGDILYKLSDQEILEKLESLNKLEKESKVPFLALYALAEGARLRDLKKDFSVEKICRHLNLSHLAESLSENIFKLQENIDTELSLGEHIGAYRSSTDFNDKLQHFTLGLEGVHACSIMGAGLGGNNIAVVDSNRVQSIKKTLVKDFYCHYGLENQAESAILNNYSSDGLEYLGEF